MDEPMSNSERRRRLFLMQEHDRAILEAAAERVDNLVADMRMDLNTIERAKRAILAPLDKTDKGE